MRSVDNSEASFVERKDGSVGLFTGDGRIGRLNYLLINLGLGLAWLACVLLLLDEDPVTGAPRLNPALIVVFPVIVWASVANMVRRLHDRGHTGWLWLLSLVPLVGLGLGPYLLFAPGDEGGNRYGPPPGKPDREAIEAKREELAQLRARADELHQQTEQSYLRDDGSYDMDWMTSSVAAPSAPPAPSALPPPEDPGTERA